MPDSLWESSKEDHACWHETSLFSGVAAIPNHTRWATGTWGVEGKNHYRRARHKLDVSTAGCQCTWLVHPVKRSWGHDLAWSFLCQMLRRPFLCLNLSVQKIAYAWWWNSFEKVIKGQDQSVLLAGGVGGGTAGSLGLHSPGATESKEQSQPFSGLVLFPRLQFKDEF